MLKDIEMKTKKDFIRDDWKTHTPKYKSYCKKIIVERVTFHPVLKINLVG